MTNAPPKPRRFPSKSQKLNLNLFLQRFSRFGIEKPVRVCDSCYSGLQGLRASVTSPSRNSNRRVTFEDEAWQNDEAAALAHYAKRSQQKEAKSQRRQDSSAKNREEVKIPLDQLFCPLGTITTSKNILKLFRNFD